MGVDMTAEGQPIGKPKESILDKRLSRRVLLGGAAVAGVGAVVAHYAPGLLKGADSSGEVSSLTPREIASGKTFSKMRSAISAASLSQADQTELLRITDDLEDVDHTLIQYENVYETNENELLRLTKAKFGNLDISSLVPSQYPSEEAFWQERFFFFKSARHLERVADVSLSSRNTWAPVGMLVATIRPVLPILPFLKSGLKPRAQKMATVAAINIIIAAITVNMTRFLAREGMYGGF